MSEVTVSPERSSRLGAGLGWAALVLILGGALVRASASADPMAYWDVDPLVTPGVRTGLGPSARAGLDVLALVGAACALLSAGVSGRGVRLWWMALLGVGGVWVALHGLVFPADPAAPGRGDLEDLIVGGGWLAALGGGVGLAHLHGRVRRVGLGLCLGFVVMLGAKGVMQRAVEHPLTMRDYEAQRAQVLGARGWREGSTQALAYERRLRQNDASGWFGMPNVYATFGGIGLVTGAGLAVGVWRREERGAALAAGLCGVCGGAVLAMSHSKGGMGGAAIGLGIGALVGSGLARGRRRVVLLAAAPVGVLLLVVARGLLGEGLGELSLLFRWQYAQGAARVILERPIFGVGPAGFRDAYLLVRPALAVEEVSSPHNTLLEWAATLGLGGVAMTGVGLAIALRAGSEGPEDAGSATNEREDVLLVALLAGGATGASALIEQAMATPEGAAMRLLGLGGWVCVAWGVMRAWRGGAGWARGAVCGGAGVIAAHSMIEVSAVWANSGALLGAILGLCAGGLCAGGVGASRARPGAGVLGAGVALLLAGLAGVGLTRLAAWEGALVRAHADVQQTSEIRDRLARLGAGVGGAGDRVVLIAQDLGRLLGEAPATDQRTLESQLRRATLVGGALAYEDLVRAAELRPDHAPTVRALSRLAIGLGDLAEGDERDAWRGRAIAAGEGLTRRRPSSPSAWAHLATMRAAVWRDGGDDAMLGGAREAWSRAFALDPLSLTIAVRQADLADAAGDREGARAWALEALRLDELKRLDPVKRLGERDGARMRRLAGE